MAAVVWTAIGLLGATLLALVGAIFQLGARIDAQGRDLRAAIEGQSAKSEELGRDLRAAIDAQARFLKSAMEAQGRDLGARIDAHLQRHAG